LPASPWDKRRPGGIAALHEHGDFERIDTVVLGFTTVNGLHIQGMAQDKVNAVFFTQIRDPVPAVHAFDTDHQIITKRFEQGQ